MDWKTTSKNYRRNENFALAFLTQTERNVNKIHFLQKENLKLQDFRDFDVFVLERPKISPKMSLCQDIF